MTGLSRLALRRMLPWWLVASLGCGWILAARATSAVPLVPGDESVLASLRALTRQNVWSLLFLISPFMLHGAARLGTDAAGAWLAPTPVQRIWRTLALGAGIVLACLLVTCGTALAGELAVGDASEAWRLARLAPSPTALLFDTSPSVRWSVAQVGPRERLRLWTTVTIGSGPAVTARLTLRAGTRTTRVEQRIAQRTPLVLAPPEGASGRLELELERIGPGALLVVPAEALEVLEPATSERLTAVTLGSHAFLWLTSACCLGLGLGRILRPSLAASLVLALSLLATTAAHMERLLPLASLPGAWGRLSRGLVPAAAPLGAVGGALALVALGLLLHGGSAPSRRAT